MKQQLPDSYYLNEDGVWVSASYGGFGYSDGIDIEKRLLRKLKNARDVSCASDELQGLIEDWPSEYHFSPLRHNLFTIFDFSCFSSILECGSGCGAMTRFLGEQNVPVLALEGSLQRAAITRARCRELENVTVCCESFGNFSPEKRFDAVTLIGVLEYSPSYMEGPDSFLAMLRKAFELLDNGGYLFLAIENQLGLKYFNGCSEDHSGIPFTGINDWYRSGTYRTLGRAELKKKLIQAGFFIEELFLPFPDYKLPRALVREAACADDAVTVSRIISDFPSRDYTGNKGRVFHESRTWRIIERNGLISDLANSFLFVARKGAQEQREYLKENDWMVQTFSCPRKKGYLARNIFKKERGMVVVDKHKLHVSDADADQHGCPAGVEHIVGKEPFRAGAKFSDHLMDYLRSDSGPADYLAYLKPWIEFVLDRSEILEIAEGERKPFIDGSLLDCHPGNIMRDADDFSDLSLIDQEWKYRSALETGFLIFRGIYRDLSNHLTVLEETGVIDGYCFQDVISMAFSDNGLALDSETIDRYVRMEIDIQLELIVYRADHDELSNYFKFMLNQKHRRKSTMGAFLLSGGLDKIAVLEEELTKWKFQNQDARRSEQQLRAEIDKIKKTWSWKVGRFLTGLCRLKLRKS